MAARDVRGQNVGFDAGLWIFTGNFYTNFAVKTSDAAGVVATLTKASRSALVSPIQEGYVVVFDEACDKQNTKEIKSVGSLLSGDLGCPVLAVLDHDDGFAMDRHAKLVAALRLPIWTVCGSFDYIEQDEVPEGLSADMLVRTP
jgi:hypothetical protein